jgi:hypothetical protein
MFRVLSLAFDLDLEDEAFDFLDNGGFEEGGRMLFCDISP